MAAFGATYAPLRSSSSEMYTATSMPAAKSISERIQSWSAILRCRASAGRMELSSREESTPTCRNRSVVPRRPQPDPSRPKHYTEPHAGKPIEDTRFTIQLQTSKEQYDAVCLRSIAQESPPHLRILKEHPHKSPHSVAENGVLAGCYSVYVFEKFGSSGRIRTYNPSVNSRTALSRLTLQTKGLHVYYAGFVGNWGDFGGTPCNILNNIRRESDSRGNGNWQQPAACGLFPDRRFREFAGFTSSTKTRTGCHGW